MIRSCRITSGYALELPTVKGNTFTFGPGLNILFGPNACGKTTVLLTAAAFAGCSKRGWSTPVGPLSATCFYQERKSSHGDDKYPKRFKFIAPGQCAAEVDWDGVPAYLNPMAIATSGAFSDNPEELSEQLGAIFAKPSSGQAALGMLGRLQSVMKETPDILDTKREWYIDGNRVKLGRANEQWGKPILEFIQYVASKPSVKESDRRVTVFIDEPDRNMSIPNQQLLWSKALTGLAKTHQVITASHSVFALRSPGAKLIEMVPGYVEECMKCLQEGI